MFLYSQGARQAENFRVGDGKFRMLNYPSKGVRVCVWHVWARVELCFHPFTDLLSERAFSLPLSTPDHPKPGSEHQVSHR